MTRRVFFELIIQVNKAVFIPLKDDNPTYRFPYVTVFLIALNCVLFIYQIFSPEGINYLIYKMGTIPYELTHFTSLSSQRIPPVLTIPVSMFLHGSLLHLAGNMLYLWIFGNNVEDYLGPMKFTGFYLFSGLAASLLHIIFNGNSRVPMIGASGAIAGILGAYMLLYPRARVLTLVFLFFFIRIVPVPAAFVLGFWFLMQVLNVGIGGGVAWFAHIGGFLAGIVLLSWISGRKPKAWI